jgi:hypothetical protein
VLAEHIPAWGRFLAKIFGQCELVHSFYPTVALTFRKPDKRCLKEEKIPG